MPKYELRFDVIENWVCHFDADSKEQAEQMRLQVIKGEINADDLPNYVEHNEGVETDYSSYEIDELETTNA